MGEFRREFLKMAGLGIAGGSVSLLGTTAASAQRAAGTQANTTGKAFFFDVRSFGATGDGKTIDSPAINAAIDAAASAGGGTVVIPAGVYVCFSIRLKSFVALFLQQGATILAADSPIPGQTTGYMGGTYDAAEPTTAWDPYQDFGHNHCHNSLIWGEDIHDFGIFGPGLIWGKGLSHGEKGPRGNYTIFQADQAGVGNKAIALKNCQNAVFRDFSLLKGGHFGLLLTGVDNVTIDNLRIDTDRDGIDIDCCKNVRVSNCTLNTPWDDAICPKSSLALGYARATENVTIANCYVSGCYELGSVADGTLKKYAPDVNLNWTFRNGRIKFGTESSGGFKNVAISNCIFEGSHGLALETVDGALVEDFAITNITMRDSVGSPFFLRLGARLRGPKESTEVGTLKRIVMSNITSHGATASSCAAICGIPGHMIEDLKISDVYLHQLGGGDSELAKRQPPEQDKTYPEITMFGEMPATGLFVRHVRNLEVSNLEVMTEAADARPAFWLMDVDGADFFRVKVPRNMTAPAFRLQDVNEFRVFGSKYLKDAVYDRSEDRSF
jgi:polygalacturonase